MFAWLRRTFGACRDRWFHDWHYEGDIDAYIKTDAKLERSCSVCGVKQRAVGIYQPDMDLTPMVQWKKCDEPN